MNATERGLSIGDASGEFWMITTDWVVREITAHFKVTVRRGKPTADDLDFISERMRDCPISRNLTEARKERRLEIVSR